MTIRTKSTIRRIMRGTVTHRATGTIRPRSARTTHGDNVAYPVRPIR